MKQKLPERRRFVRIDFPLKVITQKGARVEEVTTKNISPVGLRFEADSPMEKSSIMELHLYLDEREKPVDLTGKVIWQNKTSLEDNAPYDIGVEIQTIAEKDKNRFLKYLCDLLYDSRNDMRS